MNVVQKRRERERQARKKAILDAARRLFLHEGYNRTSVEDIAAGAELAKGTVYLYFDGKEDIYVTLVEQIMEDIHQRWLKMCDGVPPPQALERLGGGMLQEFSANNVLCDLVHRASARAQETLSTGLRQRIQGVLERPFALFAEQFRKGQEQGVFRIEDPQAMAKVYTVFLHGMVPLLSKGHGHEMDPVASLGIQTFLRGCQ